MAYIIALLVVLSLISSCPECDSLGAQLYSNNCYHCGYEFEHKEPPKCEECGREYSANSETIYCRGCGHKLGEDNENDKTS